MKGLSVLVVVGVILAIILFPFVGIWAINTLLDLGGWDNQIPYEFKSWLSIVLLSMVFGGTKVK